MGTASNSTMTGGQSTTGEVTYIEHRGLRIPVRVPVSRSTPSIKPKAIEKWIRTLPLAHDTQTAIALTTFIANSNRIDYSLAMRFKALETLQATIQSILSNLKKNVQITQWPPTERIQQQYVIHNALLNTLSTGYEICVVDILQQTGNPSRRALATCLQRGQQALGQILMASYCKYSSAPKDLWYKLHQLYLIARAYNCKDRIVKNIALIKPSHSSVAFEYKKQILLKISCPTRLLKSQIEELETQTECWAHDLELEVLTDDDTSTSQFVIDPLCDSPPLRLSQVQQQGIEPLYSIDNNKLNKRLLGILKTGKQGEPLPTVAGVTPSGTLIKLLLSDWLSDNKRSFKRTEQRGTLHASMGLTNSFNLIESNNVSSIQLQNHHSKELKLLDVQDNNSSTFKQKQFDGNISDYAKRQMKRSEISTTELQSEKIHLHHCKIINVSANGYCLQRNDDTPAKVQIGDIVALKDQANAHALHSSIGVVRWLRYEKIHGLSFGVQVLSPMAKPIRTAYHKGGRNIFLPSLSLPELPALQQAASILTSAQRYNPGEVIQINKNKQKINIRLGERLERNQGYDRFNYDIITKSN